MCITRRPSVNSIHKVHIKRVQASNEKSLSTKNSAIRTATKGLKQVTDIQHNAFCGIPNCSVYG